MRYPLSFHNAEYDNGRARTHSKPYDGVSRALKLTKYELAIDSYEQVRERTVDNDEPEKYSFGKKNNHTFKSQMIILPNGRDIVDIVAGES